MLPDGIQKRKQYNELIERGVQLLREQDQNKADLKQLKDEVEEEIGKDFAKEFNKLVKTRFSCGKVQQDAKDKLEMIAELEVLAKCAMVSDDVQDQDI